MVLTLLYVSSPELSDLVDGDFGEDFEEALLLLLPDPCPATIPLQGLG